MESITRDNVYEAVWVVSAHPRCLRAIRKRVTEMTEFSFLTFQSDYDPFENTGFLPSLFHSYPPVFLPSLPSSFLPAFLLWIPQQSPIVSMF